MERLAIREVESRWRQLARLCAEGVLVASAGRVVFANSAAAGHFALDDAASLLGRELAELIPSLGATGGGTGEPEFARHSLARDGRLLDMEVASQECGFEGEPAVQLVLRAARAGGEEIARRRRRLTPREREVMEMLVAGKQSKVIAHLLGTSTRTIDVHRARVMEKMRAASLASLVTMMLEAR